MHRRWSASIQVDIIVTEGRDFELKFVFYHNNYAEVGADGMRARKNFLHLFGPRIRHDVNVLGRATANHVADAPAREIGNVARAAQTGTDLPRRLFHEQCFHPIRGGSPNRSFYLARAGD